MTRFFAKSAVITLAALFLFAAVQPVSAQTSAGQASVLIRNVTLFDPTGGADDKTVSILVREGVLEIITEDHIDRDEANQVLDAEGGFVMGELEIGEPPSFLITRPDPRVNFRVMLDTKSYTYFAIQDGHIVSNRLLYMIDAPGEVDQEDDHWLAYTPPPVAVPLHYQDATKWNRFDTEHVSGLFMSILALDRMRWLNQDKQSMVQFDKLDEYSGGDIRGWRLGFVGGLKFFEKPWIYTIFAETLAYRDNFEEGRKSSFYMYDWRLDIPFFRNSVMSIGKQKEPLSGDRMQSLVYNPVQERSAVTEALTPSRNVGVVWSGFSPERRSSWAFGVFNDWLEDHQDFEESGSQASARVTWAPFISEDKSSVLHLGGGMRYDNTQEGFRARSVPEFDSAPRFVDTGFGTETGVLPADHLKTYNFELSWRSGPVWLASEFFRSEVQSPELGNPTFDGYWVAASWAITGEMRPYVAKSGVFHRLPVSRTVYQNGKGAWELTGRFSRVDLEDGLVHGGEMDVASLGLNWWLTPFFAVSASYRYIWNDQNGVEGESSGINTRILLMLE